MESIEMRPGVVYKAKVNGGYLTFCTKGTMNEYPGVFVDFLQDGGIFPVYSVPVATVETDGDRGNVTFVRIEDGEGHELSYEDIELEETEG